jgi:hypothetical protein
VAIVQISRITQRQGLLEDLPQPLAGAELGWAADTRQLFIGNGELVDGAPVVGNTEVLTEFSDILSFATSYTYQGQAGGYTVQTGSTASSPVTQSLQQRLDSYAIISDFGATGDGITDVTGSINRALFQIYCRSENPATRRSLYFPAGTYVITDTLNIPPFSLLYGDGADSTIIYFKIDEWTNTQSYDQSVLVYDVTSGDYYRSNFPVPVGTSLTDNNPGGDPYWTVEALPSYIMRTADSLQQVDTNIYTNSALAPGNLEVHGIKFLTNQLNNGILVQGADTCVFDSVAIQGPQTGLDLSTSTNNTGAVQWASTDSLISSNVTWNNCTFDGFTYGSNTDERIEGVTFSNNKLSNLHQGIVMGGATVVEGGATGVRVVQNIFDEIYAEGVVFNNVSLNCTAYNTFYDVGNHLNGVDNPAEPIININANNNVSVGDRFVRNNSQSVLYPRIALNNTNTMAMSENVSGVIFYQLGVEDATVGNSLDLGTYQRIAGIADTLADNTTGNLFVTSNSAISSFKMDYTIRRAALRRTGTLTVVCNNGAGGGFSYTDDFSQNGDTGITLTPTDNTTDTLVVYTSTSTGSTGTIKYSITNLG